MEVLPTLEDQDAIWATKPEVTEESDGESLIDDEEYIKLESHKHDSPSMPPSNMSGTPLPPPTAKTPQGSSNTNARERKPSLPLVRSLGLALNGSSDHSDSSSKQQLKELLRIANDIMAIDASEIAEEITRVEAKYFLDITVCSYAYFRGSF